MLDLASRLGARRGLDRIAGPSAIDQDPLLAVGRARPGEAGIDLVIGRDNALTLQNTPPISTATASPLSFCKSKIATFTPFAASARAVASPRPEEPPVTTAAMLESSFMEFPSSRLISLSASLRGRGRGEVGERSIGEAGARSHLTPKSLSPSGRRGTLLHALKLSFRPGRGQRTRNSLPVPEPVIQAVQRSASPKQIFVTIRSGNGKCSIAPPGSKAVMPPLMMVATQILPEASTARLSSSW